MSIVTGYVSGYDGHHITVIAPLDKSFAFDKKQITEVEIRIDDGRTISAEQRRKVFAIINDISKYSGHEPEYIRQHLTWIFCGETRVEPFSLSSVNMTTAKEFITYLIEFCFRFRVPTMDTLLNLNDDISRYVYLCLLYRKCVVCNKEHSHVHHVDVVGTGRDRRTINHIGLHVICLCGEHHKEVHDIGDKGFMKKYHLQSIKLDSYLCKKLGLNDK